MNKKEISELRLTAWEITRNCNLECAHCRAAATNGPYEGELDTDQAFKVIDQIAEVGTPIIILTGGEPLMRDDIFEIAYYGTKKGLRMVMAPNGTLINGSNAKKIARSGIKRISISLDGDDKKSHDKFRGVPGAFNAAIDGIKAIKEAVVEFQINTTVTKANFNKLEKIQNLAIKLGAIAHHIFLLVPTGRGKYIIDQEISAEEYEKALNWLYERSKLVPLQIKATCAPHYYRILRQRAKKEDIKVTFKTHGLDAVTRGCLGGTSFCFISHTGIVQPCGFLDINCGDVTKTSFRKIWDNCETFLNLRDYDKLGGKCGKCGFKRVCGGCRARAYEATGDYLSQEPLCNYNPYNEK